LFEQRIFVELRDRGYHVTPGVEVNNRRIDLVVTGQASRLAVECDGDTVLDSPERLRADLQREQELKRCGWTFWRVRESEYYLDPDAAMSSLWSTLAAGGIEPDSVHADPDPIQAVEWTPLDLEPRKEDIVTEVALPGRVPRPADENPSWNGWLGRAREDVDVPAEAVTEVWTMPANVRGASSKDDGIVDVELPINGFHGRRRS